MVNLGQAAISAGKDEIMQYVRAAPAERTPDS